VGRKKKSTNCLHKKVGGHFSLSRQNGDGTLYGGDGVLTILRGMDKSRGRVTRVREVTKLHCRFGRGGMPKKHAAGIRERSGGDCNLEESRIFQKMEASEIREGRG